MKFLQLIPSQEELCHTLTVIELWFLIAAVTLAFIVFKWWIVLLSLPVIWYLGTGLSQVLFSKIPTPFPWATIAVAALPQMYFSIF